MTNSLKSSLPAMEGVGFYNRHSTNQEAAIVEVMPIWRNLIGSVEVDSELVVMEDYGSSQGRNSMLPISWGTGNCGVR